MQVVTPFPFSDEQVKTNRSYKFSVREFELLRGLYYYITRNFWII